MPNFREPRAKGNQMHSIVAVDLQTTDVFGKPVNRKTGQPKQQWSLDDLAQHVLGHSVKVSIPRHPRWSDPKWQFKDSQIHYAANDAIAVSYLYQSCLSGGGPGNHHAPCDRP